MRFDGLLGLVESVASVFNLARLPSMFRRGIVIPFRESVTGVPDSIRAARMALTSFTFDPCLNMGPRAGNLGEDIDVPVPRA
jgi:phage-related protein